MSAPKTATFDTGGVLDFQTEWRQSQTGSLRQGELLTIHYDPQRLTACRGYHNGVPAWDLLATVRFSPTGETARGFLVQHTGPAGILDPPQPVPFTTRIPPDAAEVEMWFQNFGIFGCSAFDSQFGSNYRFSVTQAGPAQPVMVRTGAQRSPEMVNTFGETATKTRRTIGTGPAAGTQLETLLEITAWVRNAGYQKNVWVDLHVFDQDDNRVSSETLTLKYAGAAGGGGDFFNLEQMVFQGSGGGPGNVWPRADASKLQYRLYYEVNGTVFTDGILHQLALPADAAAVTQTTAVSAAA